MIRGGVLWLFGVACGAAATIALTTPGSIPDAEPERVTAPAGISGSRAAAAEYPRAPPDSAAAPANERADGVAPPIRQPVAGVDEIPIELLVLDEERHVDADPDAAPLTTGGGPPATLVCDYRSERDGSIVTRTEAYDSHIHPPPSCRSELPLPVP